MQFWCRKVYIYLKVKFRYIHVLCGEYDEGLKYNNPIIDLCVPEVRNVETNPAITRVRLIYVRTYMQIVMATKRSSSSSSTSKKQKRQVSLAIFQCWHVHGVSGSIRVGCDRPLTMLARARTRRSHVRTCTYMRASSASTCMHC